MKAKKRDLAILIAWPIIASIISFLTEANFLGGTLIFMGVPSLYLSLRNKRFVRKIATICAIIVVPATIVCEYLFEASHTYYIPSMFDFRLFGLVPLELFVWTFLITFLVLMYYETFVDSHRGRIKQVYPDMKYLAILFYAALFIFLLFFFINKDFLVFDFFYLKIGLVLSLLPVVIVLAKHENLYGKFLRTGAFFFWFMLVYEFTAVKLHQWTFSGKGIIGQISLFGAMFPFEELFFWVLLGSLTIVAFYEVFDDDQK